MFGEKLNDGYGISVTAQEVEGSLSYSLTLAVSGPSQMNEASEMERILSLLVSKIKQRNKEHQGN